LNIATRSAQIVKRCAHLELREGGVGVLARPPGRGHEIDFAAAVAEPPRTDAAFAAAAAFALGAARLLQPALEPGAAVRFDARAAIVEHEPFRIGPVNAVDHVGNPSQLVQPRHQRLHLGVGVAGFGGGRISPVTHGVESPRPRLVANHLGPAVAFCQQQCRKFAREHQEVGLLVLVDVDERYRQPGPIRAGQ
jgi:hypothetical protein